MQAYVTEAVGTFFLVMVFGISGDPLAVGLTLMALIYIGYPTSGAHFNPAVSIAFFFKRKLSFAELTGYLFCQVIGAFFASYLIYTFANSVFYLEPPVDTDLYEQVFSEVFFTAIFVSVMLSLTFSNLHRKNQYMGLIIGLTFTGMLMAASPLSGGVLNPAFSAGTTLFDLVKGGDSYIYSVLYVLSPIAGGALAAFSSSYFSSRWGD
ncbi:MIP/aquaporin family protein [Gracilimonas amylolytica]|uniref:MIP/aquaporin family protein n=1 Tax=Gracilimonas amylolytica TaxID=1749045 RepID=UPI000CD86ED8|nr:aquaporin [Gracilimonas amylolytica]